MIECYVVFMFEKRSIELQAYCEPSFLLWQKCWVFWKAQNAPGILLWNLVALEITWRVSNGPKEHASMFPNRKKYIYMPNQTIVL